MSYFQVDDTISYSNNNHEPSNQNDEDDILSMANDYLNSTEYQKENTNHEEFVLTQKEEHRQIEEELHAKNQQLDNILAKDDAYIESNVVKSDLNKALNKESTITIKEEPIFDRFQYQESLEKEVNDLRRQRLLKFGENDSASFDSMIASFTDEEKIYFLIHCMNKSIKIDDPIFPFIDASGLLNTMVSKLPKRLNESVSNILKRVIDFDKANLAERQKLDKKFNDDIALLQKDMSELKSELKKNNDLLDTIKVQSKPVSEDLLANLIVAKLSKSSNNETSIIKPQLPLLPIIITALCTGFVIEFLHMIIR